MQGTSGVDLILYMYGFNSLCSVTVIGVELEVKCMSDRVERVEEALEDAFEIGDGGVPDHVEVGETEFGNVQITYGEFGDPDDVEGQLNRYYIGNALRSLLDCKEVAHETSSGEVKTFVRW